MILDKYPIRGYTPIPPKPKDYSSIDYNRADMYLKLLQKKNLKYYRDTNGIIHMGTTD